MVEAEKIESRSTFDQLQDPRLLRFRTQAELTEKRGQPGQSGGRLTSVPTDHEEVSGRGESHPPALAEPGVNLSTHRAPIIQPHGTSPSRQWAKRALALSAITRSHRRALLPCRCSRLYFCMAQRTR